MDWQLAIAAAGLGLGAINVVTWWIERRDRKADIDVERKLREEEAELNRKRFELELADRALQGRAEITSTQGGSHPDGAQHQAYEFVLRNMGPAFAKHVFAWLGDGDGIPLSEASQPGPLGVNDQMPILLRGPLEGFPEGQTVRLWIGWRNSRGQLEREPSNLELRLKRLPPQAPN